MINDLLPLVRPASTRGQFPSRVKRQNAAPNAQRAAPSKAAGSLSQAWTECATVASIVRLAFSKDPARAEQIEQVIYLGSSRSLSRTKRLTVVLKVSLFLACLLAPRLAIAQETVLTPIDLFDAQSSPGVRVSPSLILQASADATILYDSNVYNDELTTNDDAVGILRPNVRLKTDLPRHAFALLGTAEIRRYFNISDEDSEQFEVKGQSLFDLGSRMTFSTEAAIAERIEPRGTAGDVFNTDRPVRFTEKKLAAELARTGGTLELILTGALAKQNFDNPTNGGVPIDLSYRDAVIRQASIRANYKLSPNIGVYGQLSGNQVDYSEQTVVPRNSSGFALLGGIRYQVTALVDVEGAVGYIQQNFDAPLAETAKGINYQLKANWTPAPYWKLTAKGQRTVDPSPLSLVPAIIRSDFELTAQRAVSDRILVEATVGYVNEDYRTTTRIDKRYIARAAVHFRVAQHIGAAIHAGYRKQDSDEIDASYDGVSAGVTLSVLL